jgi:hypothetical protein
MSIKKFESWLNENVITDAPKDAIERYTKLFYDRCKKEGIPTVLVNPIKGWMLESFIFETQGTTFPFFNGDTMIYIGFFWEDADQMEVQWSSGYESDPKTLENLSLKNLSGHMEGISDEDYFGEVISLVTGALKTAITELASIWINSGVDIDEILDLTSGDVDLAVGSIVDPTEREAMKTKLLRMKRGKSTFGM